MAAAYYKIFLDGQHIRTTGGNRSDVKRWAFRDYLNHCQHYPDKEVLVIAYKTGTRKQILKFQTRNQFDPN